MGCSVSGGHTAIQARKECVDPWRVTLNREVMSWADSRNLLFSWAYSAQTVRPPPKLTHKRHILGMSTRPRNDTRCPKLCRLSCSLITNVPSKVPMFSCFWTCITPTQKFGNTYLLVLLLKYSVRLLCPTLVNCEFKMICMQKMNVIAKISYYFSAVSLHWNCANNI